MLSTPATAGHANVTDSKLVSPRVQPLPLGGLVRGRDAVLGNFAQIPQYWDKFEVVPEEFIDGGEWVVVRGTQRATAKSGRSLEAPFVHLIKIKDGKTVRGEFYADTAKAAEALQA